MNSEAVNGSDSPTPGNLFDEFEDAFQNCLSPLIKSDSLSTVNLGELRTNAEVNAPKFLELAHRMDAAFLQKRFLLSVQKPELLIMEENHEMRVEMGRKDELIKKQTEKLAEWQNNLLNLISRVGTVPSTASTRHLPVVNLSTASSHSNQQYISNSIQATPVMAATTFSSSLNLSPSHSLPAHSSVGSSTLNRQSMMAPGQMSVGAAGIANGAGQSNFQQMSSARGHNQQQQPNIHVGGTISQIGQQTPQQQQSVGSMFPGPHQTFSAHSQGGLQGPLAYLEKTTTNIGMPDQKR